MSRLLSLAGLAALMAATLALTGCESPAGDVSVLQSDRVALVPGSTFAWAPIDEAARAAADPRVSNDIIQDRLRNAIEAALVAKGYQRVDDPGSARLVVAYHVGLEARSETQVDSYGGGPGRVACGFRGCVGGWGMYGPPTMDVRTINYTQGTLILDLIDRPTGSLAWRATSNRRIDQGDGDQATLNAILADMTRNLPGVPAPAAH